MRIWIFKGLLLLGLLPGLARAEIVTRLPGKEKRVALTFDACESRTPAFLDKALADFLVREEIPATLFVTGRFARHQVAELQALAAHPFIEIENHSLDHPQHLNAMPDAEIHRQIAQNNLLLAGITGKKPRFFRFPAGNADDNAVSIAESEGMRVVHWSFASGDPAKSVDADHLTRAVLDQVRPGAILIFHINGRGWSTAAAMPAIIAGLREKGYRFVRLDEALP